MNTWYHDKEITKKSISELQVDFRERFNRWPPTKLIIIKWVRKLFSAGSVEDRARPGRWPYTPGKVCHELEASLLRSPKKSRRKRSSGLCIPEATMRRYIKQTWVTATCNGDRVLMSTRCSTVCSDWSAILKNPHNSRKHKKQAL
jgi:hypothetical protein